MARDRVYAAVLLQTLNLFLLVDLVVFELALWREDGQVALACRYFAVLTVPLYPLIALLNAVLWCL